MQLILLKSNFFFLCNNVCSKKAIFVFNQVMKEKEMNLSKWSVYDIKLLHQAEAKCFQEQQKKK